VDSMIDETKKIVNQSLLEMYGDNPHPYVLKRVERELNSIIKSGYYSTYYMSHLLVKKSLENDYLVGSRGSVGSSLVATLMKITEINPLPPHYVCKKCYFTAFKFSEEEKGNINSNEEKELQTVLSQVESGYDLPTMTCPKCQSKLWRDGHDIPFETFLGFDGDKVPDIDLNFSGEFQPKAHEFVRDLMGTDYAFRGGTITTVAENNAFAMVKKYSEENNMNLRRVEIERISKNILGSRKSTGQHPGGIIILPKNMEIYDITPIQYPADNIGEWRTTHFDYHSFENNLLKLDILGHDDPTMIKYLMDYVKKNPKDFPFDNAIDIPVDDENVYKLCSSTDVINVKEEDINSKVSSFGIPELGTNFVRQMLTETLPKTFAELVKISGLSHGTDVWINNAKSLVLGEAKFEKVSFSDVIGCRDDIMVYLMYQGLEPIKAFEIMEFVRKGRVHKDNAKWQTYKENMIAHNVPEWYIWSCEQIKYMFPKAHATAYVLMALRIAWFKVYSPLLFYSAFFSKRVSAVDYSAMITNSIKDIKEEIAKQKSAAKTKESETSKKAEDTITSLQIALEMVCRGFKFLPVDLNKSDSFNYQMEDNGLRIPFIALPGLGDKVAISIIEQRNIKSFTSVEDFKKRTGINKTVFLLLEMNGFFSELEEHEAVNMNEGLFA
ncbi:MAG: PolC-type DNA polymerase III, partial [Anaeroplasmataceae bacterium]